MSDPPPPPDNRILNGLPPAEYRRLSRHLQPVRWYGAGEALHRPEWAVTHIHFPVGHAAAVVAVCWEGECVGVGLVGAESLVGVAALFGVVEPPLQAFVHLPGEALYKCGPTR